jgi:hypothetical protein
MRRESIALCRNLIGAALAAILCGLSISCHEVADSVDSDASADGGTDENYDCDAGATANPYVGSLGNNDWCLEEIAGYLYVGVSGSLDSGDLGYWTRAEFYQVTESDTDPLGPVEHLIEADGADSCSLMWCGEPYSGDLPEPIMEWQSAGEVVLSAGADSISLPMPWYGKYQYDLGATGHEPLHGEEYSLSVAGDEAAPLVLDPAFTLPAAVSLTAPVDGTEVPPAPLALEWTAGPDPCDYVETSISVWDTGGPSAVYHVQCTLYDDGEFEIPAEVMEEFPSGWHAVLVLGRWRTALVPYGDGTSFVVSWSVVDGAELDIE